MIFFAFCKTSKTHSTLTFWNFNCFEQLMLGKTLDFLSSKIWMMSSSKKSGKQPSNCQSNQNPKTSYHTHHLRFILLDLWPCISGGLQKYLAWKTFHWCNLKSVKGLKRMILNESPHDNSRNCHHIFHRAHNGIPQQCFLWASKKWPGEV